MDAKKNYYKLIDNVNKNLKFSFGSYKKTEAEFSNINLLGWSPVNFTCHLKDCEYNLITNNTTYVGVPNIVMGYKNIDATISGNNLVILGIQLATNKVEMDEKLFKRLPSCNEIILDMRKLESISRFKLDSYNSRGKVNSSFSFQQPKFLIKDHNLFKKNNVKYINLYSINWNAQNFDITKLNYIARYALMGNNIGISSIKKIYNESVVNYSLTGVSYCRVH